MLKLMSIGYIRSCINTHCLHTLQVTNKLVSHPCVISVPEMGAVRHFLKTNFVENTQEERYRLLNATLEINPKYVCAVKSYTTGR